MPKKKSHVFTVTAVAKDWAVEADGQRCKTPAGADYVVPTERLAEAIAEEWKAQNSRPKPETMPMAQLAATAIDIVQPHQAEITRSVAAMAAHDLLCHRAEEPAALVEEQHKIWQPWLDGAAQNYGIRLKVGAGVMPLPQPPEALEVATAKLAAYDAFTLTGLQQGVSLTGSLLLGLALLERQADVAKIFAAAELESLFQMRQWGEDPVTLDRHAQLRRELENVVRWFGFLRR